MTAFEALNLSKPLLNALEDLGFNEPTPIQEQAYPVVLSGRDVVGIAQTGTGKTMGYLLPILRDFKFSEQVNPRVLILVPTRELVLQTVEHVEAITKYMTVRVKGVYGGTNINTQQKLVADGMDILVATPGRLYDLVLKRAVALKDVKKLVIDEVDVMLDLGFRFGLTNIMELLPEKRQNILFSATMTEDVHTLIEDLFASPVQITIAVSGTPLKNIDQQSYLVKNFYTKVNFLIDLLRNKKDFHKVLVFVDKKKNADHVFEALSPYYGEEACILHANKSQNYRIRSLRQFNEGQNRIMITTDVMARGLDLSKISHVISMDVPVFPENYIHRIGRTGRAEEPGTSILLFTEKEEEPKIAIEVLMDLAIPVLALPDDVEQSSELLPEERPKAKPVKGGHKSQVGLSVGLAFHEKKDKNKKINMGGSYKRKPKKHKKPITRGDKNQNK